MGDRGKGDNRGGGLGFRCGGSFLISIFLGIGICGLTGGGALFLIGFRTGGGVVLVSVILGGFKSGFLGFFEGSGIIAVFAALVSNSMGVCDGVSHPGRCRAISNVRICSALIRTFSCSLRTNKTDITPILALLLHPIKY